MTHNCQKLEKYLFLGISGCIFALSCGHTEGESLLWRARLGLQPFASRPGENGSFTEEWLQGVPVNPHVKGFRICRAKGGRK